MTASLRTKRNVWLLRAVATATLTAALAACGSDETTCRADDSGDGTLAATAVYASATPSADTGLHDASCSATVVSVHADVPVDSSLETGALLPPPGEPLATGTAGDERPATFELPAAIYLVCFALPGQLPLCTRVTVGTERVIATMFYHGSPTFEIR